MNSARFAFRPGRWIRCGLPLLLALGAAAQDRTAAALDANERAAIAGGRHKLALPQFDRGPVDASAPISYAAIFLAPQPGIEAFLAELHTPGSPNFHRWLTPDQFGDRFGASAADMARVTQWLTAEGLAVHDLAQGRQWITFSGTAESVGRAFRTELHRYEVGGKIHFAPSSDPTVPAAIARVVSGLSGLDDFEFESQIHSPTRIGPVPTSGGLSPDYLTSGNRLSPGDFAIVYNVKPLYDAGFDGTGQSIAVIGRSAINIADMRKFRSMFGLPANDPKLLLFGPDPGKTTSELEAALDLEWAGGVAKNATINYVYAASVNTAVLYAVDQNVAPVMTWSFGSCEYIASQWLRAVAQQANAQGITWMASSGDQAAGTCDAFYGLIPQGSLGPTVSFPASVPEITAVGGTQFAEGTGRYWATVNDPNGVTVASYIPERAWNTETDGSNAPGGTGGGPSALYTKPYWQTGPGVPNDGVRDVPDVALSASGAHDQYEIVYENALYAVGGTSASSPSFAGIVAILNQYTKSPGQGNINPTLYQLAVNSPEAFHDIVAGDNTYPCAQGTSGCVNGYYGFAAGPGYDMATGLGSVDAFKFVTRWNVGQTSSTTVVATPDGQGPTGNTKVSVAVQGQVSGVVPTGTVLIVVGEAVAGSASLDPAGNAAITVSSTAVLTGNGTILALYQGDATYAGSSGSASASFTLPTTSATVVMTVSPDPVPAMVTIWPYVVTVAERGGVAATITSFTIDGTAQSIAGSFGSAALPASGTLRAILSGSGLAAPLTRKFHIGGVDAKGQTFSQDLSVPFLSGAAGSSPGISLTLTPASPQLDPSADPSCAWKQRVVVRELGGYWTQLASLAAGSSSLSSSISTIFGTTRLAPLGTLQGTLCWPATPTAGARNVSLLGVSEIATIVSATGTATLAAAPVTPPLKLGLTPASVTLPGATSTLAVSVGVDVQSWSASVVTLSPGPTWLTVSPSSGSGDAQLTLKASSTGLSNGVYFAKVVVESSGTLPQFVESYVVLNVGTAGDTSIAAVTNAASFKTSVAPGMVLSAFGANLDGVTSKANTIPLPFASPDGVSATVNGVSAPLYFVSPGQINLQVPYETSVGPAVLGIVNNGQVASFQFQVAPAAPGVFASGTGDLVPYSSGKRGDVLLAFITGEGDSTPFAPTGNTPASTTTVANLPRPRLPVSMTVGGVPATIAFVGEPSGLAGVMQINFTVPAGAPLGAQPVIVTVGGVDSAPVNLTVLDSATSSASR